MSNLVSSIDDDGLFDVEAPPPVSLADRFVMPPFSVLDRRSGDWAERKRRWLSVGIQSEVGRPNGMTFGTFATRPDLVPKSTSTFDPVVCELVYRWFSRPGSRVLDPFAGGSVRGVVASTLARWYYGIDIRQEQIAANRAQLHLCSDIQPVWFCGDATRLDETLGATDEFDLIFSCPPYASLERYSDDPRDISTWAYEEFLDGHAKAIRDACARLRNDRYAAWVIGDIRDRSGGLVGLHRAAVGAFESAGLRPLNEFILVDQLGNAAVRAARPFVASRKATQAHQYLLVFVKGDVRKAAQWAVAS